MKAVILAGGFGTRLAEETSRIPKPMVEIGGMPMLWHIMKIYSHYGVRDFIICLGYKGYIIKEYFCNYHLHTSDITVNTRTGDISVHREGDSDWNISLINTGLETMTGGRIKRIRDYVDEDFFLTYGDGLSNVDINKLAEFHKASTRRATLTATLPPGRFGALNIEDGQVNTFEEKPRGDNVYVNGGFFVLSPEIFDYIDGPSTIWEREPLELLASDGQLGAFKHDGFWQPMDTLRDKQHLEGLWDSGQAPWKVW